MNPHSLAEQSAERDFEEARFEAALRHVLARLTRTSDELLAYEEVARQLNLSARTDRGIQTIPVAAIVGSVGRAADFTRTFLPRRNEDRERWTRVHKAFLDPQGEGVPPIEVYQVGEAYFVLDGNHRVSVARRSGVTYIEAHVIEIQTPVPLTPDTTPDELIGKAEQVAFLEEAGLGELESGFDLSVSVCGQYPKLREQIAVHQYLLNREGEGEISFREAAADWLAAVYAPLAQAIRERGLLQWFPGHTETDLYIWVTEHEHELEEDLGWAIRPEAAVTDLAVRASREAERSETAPGSWRARRLAARYVECLFKELLVPLHEAPTCLCAVKQAVQIAKKEGALIHGLHIVRGKTGQADPTAQALHAHFTEQCAAAGVACDFAVETGAVAERIRERGLLADLIVMNLSHPPEGGLSALTSGWRSILKNAARPVLAVPGSPASFERALLVYNGSVTSEQALFAAAYMGERWNTALTVLVTADESNITAFDYVRRYLELHELSADIIRSPRLPTNRSAQLILDTLDVRNLDVLLIGADSASSWQQVRGSSIVNTLLRQTSRPILIC